METENACRVMKRDFAYIKAGTIGALVPLEENSPAGTAEFEYIAGGKIHIESVSESMLRQASRDEFKSFQSDMWDVYDRTNWN